MRFPFMSPHGFRFVVYRQIEPPTACMLTQGSWLYFSSEIRNKTIEAKDSRWKLAEDRGVGTGKDKQVSYL